MHEIQPTELTKSENEFIKNSLVLIEETLTNGPIDLMNVGHHYASALAPVIDAEELVIEANRTIDLVEKDGNSIDVDFKLLAEEIEYRNYITEIKRSPQIVAEILIILGVIRRITDGKSHEYSEKLTELEEIAANANQNLLWCIASEQWKYKK